MSDQPAMHSPAANDVITTELVACTLGQRQRLELRVDTWGRILQALRVVRNWRRPTPDSTPYGPVYTARHPAHLH